MSRRNSRRAAREKREATRKKIERDVEKENLQRLLSAYEGLLMNIKAEKKRVEGIYMDLVPHDIAGVLVRAKKGPKSKGIPLLEEVKVARGAIGEKLAKEKDLSKIALLKEIGSVLKKIQKEEIKHGKG